MFDPTDKESSCGPDRDYKILATVDSKFQFTIFIVLDYTVLTGKQQSIHKFMSFVFLKVSFSSILLANHL